MKPLLKITEKIVEKKISRLGSIQTHIFLNWHHIAEKYAGITFPENIKFFNKKKMDGQITLKVQSGFGPEIQMAIPFLINQINARFGYKAISKIKILQTDIGFIDQKEKVLKILHPNVRNQIGFFKWFLKFLLFLNESFFLFLTQNCFI